MRRLTLDAAMMGMVVVALLTHYLVYYTIRQQHPEKQHLWRAIICVTERSAVSRLTAIWWIQVGLKEADVVQIPAAALIGQETGENTPSLASLYGTPQFPNRLRRFTRYMLGLPAQRVIECSLEDLLDYTIGEKYVSIFMPSDILVVLDNKSVFTKRGTHRLSRSELRDLWSGYSFWGGEWGRLQRQRLILQAILHTIPSDRELPESLLWLAHLQRAKVHYITVPGSRRHSWTGAKDDVIQIAPASFYATARRLREKDKYSDIRVRLCFSPKVPLATQEQIIEEIFDSGFSVYVDDGSYGCRNRVVRATENLPEDIKRLQAIVQRHAVWGGYCQQGEEIGVVVH